MVMCRLVLPVHLMVATEVKISGPYRFLIRSVTMSRFTMLQQQRCRNIPDTMKEDSAN